MFFKPLSAAAVALGLAVSALAAPALAGDAEPLRRITVTGEGQANAAPDMAIASIGVQHRAATARDALDKVKTAMAATLERMRALDIAPRDLQTGTVALRPIWPDRSRQAGTEQAEAPVPESYDATLQLTVRVRDLDLLGRVLDAAVSDGANRFDGLSFGLQDPDPVRNEARRDAVKRAMAKAALYAEAAGVRLGPLVSLSEAGPASPAPRMMEMAFKSSAASEVPTAPGELTLNASVSLVFGLAGQTDQ